MHAHCCSLVLSPVYDIATGCNRGTQRTGLIRTISVHGCHQRDTGITPRCAQRQCAWRHKGRGASEETEDREPTQHCNKVLRCNRPSRPLRPLKKSQKRLVQNDERSAWRVARAPGAAEISRQKSRRMPHRPRLRCVRLRSIRRTVSSLGQRKVRCGSPSCRRRQVSSTRAPRVGSRCGWGLRRYRCISAALCAPWLVTCVPIGGARALEAFISRAESATAR